MATMIIKNALNEPINQICPECGSEFTFTYEDIRVEENNYMVTIFPPMRKRFVECPVCKYAVSIEKNCNFKIQSRGDS